MVISLLKKTIAIGYHNGHWRSVAHNVKKMDFYSIMEAAERMASICNKNTTLVPIPSHTGDAEYTWNLATAISQFSGSVVLDALQGFTRNSSHEAKLQGKDISKDIWFYKICDVPEENVILIDNCVATGKTADAARKALDRPNATCLSITLTK